MNYKGGRGVVPSAGVCPGKMIVKFRGWPRDMDMCSCFPLSRRFPECLTATNCWYLYKKEASEIQKPLSGDRRSRTDDPLLAKQML